MFYLFVLTKKCWYLCMEGGNLFVLVIKSFSNWRPIVNEIVMLWVPMSFLHFNPSLEEKVTGLPSVATSVDEEISDTL